MVNDKTETRVIRCDPTSLYKSVCSGCKIDDTNIQETGRMGSDTVFLLRGYGQNIS